MVRGQWSVIRCPSDQLHVLASHYGPNAGASIARLSVVTMYFTFRRCSIAKARDNELTDDGSIELHSYLKNLHRIQPRRRERRIKCCQKANGDGRGRNPHAIQRVGMEGHR